jgi:hypothetical protein
MTLQTRDAQVPDVCDIRDVIASGTHMTFTVVQIGGESEKVLGTVWASAEAEARMIAIDLHHTSENEERELPLTQFN